jgi:hypothetical protein
MITIPDDATPADAVGETDILSGQDWLMKPKLLRFADQMMNGTFDWDRAQRKEAMKYQIGSNGTILYQGHHRWVAARLAGIQIPVKILLLRDFWPGPVPYAKQWTVVTWESEEYDDSPFD